MLINEKLSAGERASVLRKVGFEINRNSGQVTGLKNIAYDDQNPDLSINLDTGFVRDFGDSEYNGDIINLISKVINKDFNKTVDFISEIIGRDLREMDGLEKADLLYNTGEGARAQKPKKTRVKFWNKKKWNAMVKCHNVLKEKGIPESMKFIQEYDGISLDKLIEMNCGIYGFKDFEFGLSGKSYSNVPFFVFPYKTGAMLYRRNEDGRKFFDKDLPPGKEVRNVKGSHTNESFFNIEKEERERSCLFVMKSPRECLSFSKYNPDFKTISIVTGEEIGSISDYQKEQVDSFLNKKKSAIYLFFDCDNPDAYDKSLKSAKEFSKAFSYSLVYLVNIYKYTEGKCKDFTDLIQRSKKEWDVNSEDFTCLKDKLSKQLVKSIMEAEVIK